MSAAELTTAMESVSDPDVAAVFCSYPEAVQPRLLALRELILTTAEATEGVGAIEETLRWGQPSYLTSETGSGSTIRIAATRPGSSHDFGMYFVCRTTLVAGFQHLFGDVFAYEGNRALLFTLDREVPVDQLRACIALALTYHLARS